ncbi:MAG TPA: sulfur oxidation c-type cytochrome SoxA [Burkholderiales bacterium]|nr:sulfur oxidation c-type cytochrome SoxA [Burkholderiales bacterium]
MRRRSTRVFILTASLVSGAALAQSAVDEIAKYREALAAGNPAELWEARGEDLWKQKRGPKNGSLEACDLGKGPGVVKGAYAELPRYFADADRVMDLETRLVHCMVTLQGMKEAEVTARPYGAGNRRSDFEALAAYIAAESRSVPMKVPMSHPKERVAAAIGEKIFYFRGGPHDFACATCHSENGKRIRLQDLPNLTERKDAQRGYTTWPAYRVSQGELRTMQWRLYDCFRQQRFPELKFGSEASVALTSFLAHNAQDGVYAGPAIKR